MPAILKYIIVAFIVFNLFGCALLETSSEQTERLCADENGNFYSCVDMPVVTKNIKQHSALFASDLLFVQISEYTQQMALALDSDLATQYIEGNIVVTPFIYGNDSSIEADALGRELALNLLNDLSDLGVPTSTSSIGDVLFRTSTGVIEFSNEQQKMMSKLDVSYVLIGNMLRNNSGLMLTAKVLNLQSGKVVASSRKLLPNIVLNKVL